MEASDLVTAAPDLAKFLEQLGLSPGKNDGDPLLFSKDETALIKSVETDVSKHWKTGISAVAAIAVGGSSIGAWIAKPGLPLQLDLVASGAFVLAAAVVAVALLAGSDVRARAAAAAGNYAGEAAVVGAFIASQSSAVGSGPEAAAGIGLPASLRTDVAVGLLAATAARTPVAAHIKGKGDDVPLTGLKYEDGILQVRIVGSGVANDTDEWVPLTGFDQFILVR